MAKSIISNERECYICKNTLNLEKHHIFYGNPNRKLSEEDGLWVYLCPFHHRNSRHGVHFSEDLNQYLKKIGQAEFEKKKGTRGEFLKRYGKNYL